MFLTQDEIEQLTGYKTSRKQRDYLQEKGIRFDVSKSGEVKLLIKTLEHRQIPSLGEATRATAPNFGAITHG